MYLKELKLNGFKSFAKKSELEFSSPITAIVGPNGSGKSNIAEAFRFVLGEQSVKSMRGKKGEDLIWGGSEKVTHANRASVELFLDNSNRLFSLDFDEIKLERIVHRDGQNEYKLNDSAVRLKDIHEILANANIGSTGHHIISQGEADRILAANPKERREMIEDALGLKVYQLKKQEADRKLLKTHENIAQVQSLRREAAPHLKYLKRQVEKAERSLELQNQLKEAFGEYLKREDIYLATRTDYLNITKREPVKRLEEVNEEVEKLNKHIEDISPEEDTEAIEAAKVDLEELTVRWQEAQHEYSQLKGQISYIKRRLEKNDESKPKNRLVSQSEVEEMIARVTESAERELDNNNIETLRAKLQNLIEELRAFIKQAEVKTDEITEDDLNEMQSLEKQAEKQAGVLEDLKDKREVASIKLQELQSAQVTELGEQREAEKQLFILLGERRELEARISSISGELATLERDRNDFKQELQEAVALLGRSASSYIDYDLRNKDNETLTTEEIVNEDRSLQRQRQRSLEKMKIRLEELGVGETSELIKEYNQAKERDDFLEKELSDLFASVQNLQELLTDLQTKLESQFVEGVDKITAEFQRFFTLMFGGGSAGLEMVKIKSRQAEEEEEEVSEDGVELNVSLPNKRVKGLNMLSGGERALTSIALIFAMSQVNPPPFIILDETDAALDEANSRRYGDMIEALSKRSQLVLITHNRETMSRAGILYGITMGTDGFSKVLSVKFEEAAENAK